MSEITCPYCGHCFNDDEYYENNQESLYEIECPNCDKIMMASFILYPIFNAYAAPCKNGKEHKLKKISGIPEYFFKYKRCCEYCDEEFIIDKKKHEECCKERKPV